MGREERREAGLTILWGGGRGEGGRGGGERGGEGLEKAMGFDGELCGKQAYCLYIT